MPILNSTILKFALIAGLLAVLPAVAAAQSSPPPLGKPVFCNKTYALCIKALCKPVVQKNGTVTNAVCECDVRDGWSMGPGSCESRNVIIKNGRKHIVSTYSNLYNATNQTMSCSYSGQNWAWCYGAPCIVDKIDPSKSTCNCPVYQGAMYTLGGACGTDHGGCDSMWSAATPKADTGANVLFAAFMKSEGFPHLPPAQMCPAPKASSTKQFSGVAGLAR